MKKTLLTLALVTATVAAFAQGKISFQNDSLHLAYYETTTAADAALLGKGVMAGTQMPNGVTLVADLYMGTSSSSLSLLNTTSFSTANVGKWNSVSISTGTPAGGTAVFLEVILRDSAFSAPSSINPATLAPFGTYFGKTPEFNFTLGSGITYPPMYGASGNWPVGTFDMSTETQISGARGSIPVNPVPEPATLALAGLGAAALMIFRRRK